MVVFTCGECGEAMKKAQVESHYQRKCRNCNVLSCLDCGKDFWGKDYEQHTKCISEEEKYSGKNYVAKPNANKGEVKQQNWIQEVQNAIDKVKANPRLRGILERMKDYPNIPRKKAKFENFLKNSLRVYDKGLASQVWDLLMTNTEKPQKADKAPVENGNSKASNTTQQQIADSDRLENKPDQPENEAEKTSKKISKREKKEERRKKANKNEKKDKHMNGNENCDDTKVHKKSKKRKKHETEDEGEEKEEEDEVNRSKKRKHEEEEEDDQEEDETAEPQKKVFKTKFKWNEVIVEVLKSKGEMKLKKLRRKVLSEYLSQGCTAKSEEKLWAKFDSKLKKNSAVKVLHEKAKLIA